MNPESSDVTLLQTRLLDYFDHHKRDLPWRENRSPYRVWVSEIMLQQTRVDTVIPYFLNWMDRYPTLQALAEADRADVLKSWEGLGYYSRARNLHEAARMVREQPGAALPTTAKELERLPGIGEYTAGAIASIANGERVPAVDGNVRRVLSRLFDLTDPTLAPLRERARELVPPERPGDWNEALMELGATVCTPKAPGCDICPISASCAALAAGTVAERPGASRRAKVRSVEIDVIAPVGNDGRLYLVRRPHRGLLGGLWQFPQSEPDAPRATAGELCEAWGLKPIGSPRSLEDVPHAFTHLRATYRTTLLRCVGGREEDGARWFDIEEAVDLALPVAQRRILDLVRDAVNGRSGLPSLPRDAAAHVLPNGSKPW